MKESIKSEPWIKISEIDTFYLCLWPCLSIIFLMSALIIGALVNYEDMHKYYQKYCTKKEKVEYQVVKCAENEQGDYYLCLRNLKTRKKIMKECDFNDYTLYEPGDKITYNLTKADIMGEESTPNNPAVWIGIAGISGLCIICAGLILFCLLDFDKDEVNPVMALTMIIGFLSSLVALILFILE